MEFIIQETNELSEVEEALIKLIYSTLKRIEKLKAKVLEEISNNCDEAIKATNEIKWITSYDGPLVNLKELFFLYAKPDTLRKIVEEEKFNPLRSYQEKFTISKEVLKKINSYTEVHQSDPKAAVAKKLGAKIVI